MDEKNLMDVQVCYDFIKRLNINSLDKLVQESLHQSLLACEAGDVELMLELAQAARQTARVRRDQIGQATALIHLGMVRAQMNQFDKAADACEQARRIYHSNPTLHQRYGEGMAMYGLGLIFQHHSTGLYDNRTKAISYYQDALDLFEDIKCDYAAAGDDRRFREIQNICNDIRGRIISQTPQIYIETEASGSPSPTNWDQETLDSQPGIDSNTLPSPKISQDRAWGAITPQDVEQDIEQSNIQPDVIGPDKLPT